MVKKFDTEEGCGDGDYTNGFKVETGLWIDKYAISVKFNTIYYGK